MSALSRRRLLIWTLYLASWLNCRAQWGVSEEEPAWWHAGVGISGIVDRDRNICTAMSIRFSDNLAGFHPYLSARFTSNGAFYGGGGLLRNLDFTRRFRLTAGSGPGYYARSRRGTDLGFQLEFVSTIELSYSPNRRSRIGVALSHLSNLHLSRINPGTELLEVTYAIRAW